MKLLLYLLGFLDIAGSTLCVGSEWHRFPSSFFVPEYISAVRWIDDGFRGLLPLPFNSTLGGNAAAPPYFNNKNRASDEQYVIDPKPCCSFFSSSLRFCYKVNNASFSCSSEILKLALSLLSCSLIDLTLLVEVTCQLGRYI